MSSEHPQPQPIARTPRRYLSNSPTPPPLTAHSPIEDVLDPLVPLSSGSLPTTSDRSLAPVASGSAPVSDSRAPHETLASPISSPSLMKIINQTNISPGAGVPSKRKRASSPSSDIDIIDVRTTKNKGKGKAKAISISPTPPPSTQATTAPEAEPLSEYTCPICFFPPSNATCTPCGHVCCGSCLFTAVKTTLQRGAGMSMAVGIGENVARCPVCRAVIPGWDGKGGGVIGLKLKQVIIV